MKKQLTVALGLAVLATPAFASKARLQALGEDTNGSFYINDNRNIFLNAAHVNNHKGLVTFETGSETTDSKDDNAVNPRPEGGVFFGQGNMVYGVQLGNESNTSNALRTWSSVSTEQNVLDVFVGGDAGMKWGANLSYSNVTESATVNNDKMMRTRLGVSQGDWDAFANISLNNEVQMKNGDEFEGKLGYQVGGSYLLNDYKLFAEYRSIKAEDTKNNDDAEIGLWRVGAGRTAKLNDKANLFTKVEISRQTITEDKGAFGQIAGEDLVTTNLPVVIGMEVDASSWLTLRGSVSQSLYSDIATKGDSNSNLENTTVVNAGATLKFGELSIDGVIGNTTADAVVPASTLSTTGGYGTNGSLRTDNLMSRVSMTYKF